MRMWMRMMMRMLIMMIIMMRMRMIMNKMISLQVANLLFKEVVTSQKVLMAKIVNMCC